MRSPHRRSDRFPVVLGVDAGGTKTDVLVVAQDGRVVGRSRGGGANHEAVGIAAAERELAGTLPATLDERVELAASAVALAGLDWPCDEAAFRPRLAALLPGGPLVLVNDVFAALRVGIPHGAGVVVVAGTGVIAAGRAADGRSWRTLGMSSGPGDWGGGPEIVRAAVNAIAQAYMGLGPGTALQDLVLARTGTAQAADYLEGAQRRGRTGITPADIWDMAAAGDAVAAAIADRTARSLAAAAVVVAAHLDLTGPVDVVLAGRVLDPGHPFLQGLMTDHLTEALPTACPRRLGVPPVLGAALLAADAAGWPLSPEGLAQEVLTAAPPDPWTEQAT